MLRRIILTMKFMVFQNTSLLNQIFCFLKIKLKLNCWDIEAKNGSFYGLSKIILKSHGLLLIISSLCLIIIVLSDIKKKPIPKKNNPINPKIFNHKVSLISFGQILELHYKMNSNSLFID